MQNLGFAFNRHALEMAEHSATDEGRGCTGINSIDQHTATDLNESIQKKTETTMSATSLSPGGDSIKEYMQLSGQRLTGLFFSGRYEDRIWVEPLGAYRDRVVVDDYQTDVIKTLKTIHRKAKKAVPHFNGIQSKRRGAGMSFQNTVAF